MKLATRFGMTQHGCLRALADDRRAERAAFEQSVLDAVHRTESDVRAICEALRLVYRSTTRKRVLGVLEHLEARGLVESRIVETDRKRNAYRAIRAEAAE